MQSVNIEFLRDRLELADQLLAGRETMFDPQDLPGRYGRVVSALDRVLSAINCAAVVGGGWAVWRYGYFGRMTQDIDIVLPSEAIDEFLKAASVSGFKVFAEDAGRWPTLLHTDTDVKVDVLPEGGRPGTEARPAPTMIRHPSEMGAAGCALRYIELPSLIELKLAAGRARDESDVVELVRANPERTDAVRHHLEEVHAEYLSAFDRLVQRAHDQQDQ